MQGLRGGEHSRKKAKINHPVWLVASKDRLATALSRSLCLARLSLAFRCSSSMRLCLVPRCSFDWGAYMALASSPASPSSRLASLTSPVRLSSLRFDASLLPLHLPPRNPRRPAAENHVAAAGRSGRPGHQQGLAP
ncbi:unnamed protein product [Arctogadus glacialis]